MSVSRKGAQITSNPHKNGRSHVSGKRANRFAAKIKDNLEAQCQRLEQELLMLNPKSRESGAQELTELNVFMESLSGE